MTQDTRQIMANLLIISIIASGVLYEDRLNKENYKINDSLKHTTEIFKNDTKLDEAIDKKIATYNNMPITEAADYLEDSIDIVEMLNIYDFSEVVNLDKLTEEEYSFAESLTKEDIILLTTALDIKENDDSLEFEETRIKTIKMLDHVKTTREKWIKKHGKDVVLYSLAWVLKASVADELGIEPEEIQDIEIPPVKKIQDMKFYLVYNDHKYYMTANSSLSDVLYYRYQVKSTNDYTGEDYRLFKEALNSAKVLTTTGVDTKNNKFVNVRTLKEAKKELNTN
jgi:hypothetical protein